MCCQCVSFLLGRDGFQGWQERFSHCQLSQPGNKSAACAITVVKLWFCLLVWLRYLLMRNNIKILIGFTGVPKTYPVNSGNPEKTPSLLQPAVILNIKNPGHSTTDYPKLVYRKPSLNWTLKVYKNFISTLLHLNWVFLALWLVAVFRTGLGLMLGNVFIFLIAIVPKPLMKWEHQ